jgi:hypothetical protein
VRSRVGRECLHHSSVESISSPIDSRLNGPYPHLRSPYVPLTLPFPEGSQPEERVYVVSRQACECGGLVPSQFGDSVACRALIPVLAQIKCDESHPICERCREGGFDCLWIRAQHDQLPPGSTEPALLASPVKERGRLACLPCRERKVRPSRKLHDAIVTWALDPVCWSIRRHGRGFMSAL